MFSGLHGKTGSLVLVFMSTSRLSGGCSGNYHDNDDDDDDDDYDVDDDDNDDTCRIAEDDERI